jgi:16S rRNA (guanine966-N2)-methyltransferase
VTRIISGAFGGRRIEVPPGAATRPTSDRVREALFGRLSHQDVLGGARVLDLFAGSGALGLEAVSRGARSATFVESHRPTLEVLRRNVSGLIGPSAEVACSVVGEPVARALLRGADEPYDVVLADPPYAMPEEELADVLALLPLHHWLAVEAVVVVERSSRSPEPRWPAGMGPVDERRYGETRVWWARTTSDPTVA